VVESRVGLVGGCSLGQGTFLLGSTSLSIFVISSEALYSCRCGVTIKEDRSLAFEYESKATQLRTILTNAGRDPDECYNLTSARIDLLEMQGDADSLKLVSCCQFVCCCCSLWSPLTLYCDAFFRTEMLVRTGD
jgi:hypothetical protein